MSLRTILVHLDGGDAEERLSLARSWAAVHHAEVHAMFAHDNAPGSAMEHGRSEARKAFARLAAQPGAPLAWHESREEDPLPAFNRRAMTSDLVVVGQPAPTHDRPTDSSGTFVLRMAAHNGCPTLVAPAAPRNPFSAPRVVVLAWRPVREASVASRAALPVLRRAREVHVVTWSEDRDARLRDQRQLVDHLRRHDITNVHRHEGALPHDLARAMLALAAAVRADLLVMGCNGRSATGESALGGTTRTVLREARLPVLTAH
jgi:nucleotide-binding universal stress UspA family protein